MNFTIWVLVIFSILIGSDIRLATAQDNFWGYHCPPDGRNYTYNETYKRNLDDILYSLTGKDNGFGFYNSTVGLANAAALCYGDIGPERCRRCVDDATRRLRQICPDQIEAMGWYDVCLLRYSDRLIDIGDGYPVLGWNHDNLIPDSIYEKWNQTVVNLLGRLRLEAAGGDKLRKYASGNITATGLSTIYGMTQCTPDLSAKGCDNCLAQATEVSQIQRTSVGVRVYMPYCVLRYENYTFFNSTWFPAVYPPPSDKTKGTNIADKTKSTNIADKTKSIKLRVIIGPILAAVVVITTSIIFFIFRRRQKQKRKGPLLPESEFHAWFSNGSPDGRENDDTGEINSFALTTILVATSNFAIENKLGEGGFGPVYRGKLQDGKEIAVKRLSSNSGQGLVEFKTEVKLIIKLQHKNLVRLLGYCIKGNERLLIYEFMANNSLDKFLFDPNKCKELDWAKRSNIVSGIAKGLRYLHEESRLKIIHRDMKAGNILLDDEMNSKISDFGTARIFGGKQMEANTNRIVGTYGYMAPEYAMEGLFSTKSDVYSFGVLLLEIVSGQRNNRFCYQDEPQNLLSTAYQLWKESKGEQLIDGHLIQNFPIAEAIRWINIALLCVQEDPQDRPTMSNVVFMLEGQWSSNLPTPSEPPLSFARFAVVYEQTSTTSEGSAHPSIMKDLTSSISAPR